MSINYNKALIPLAKTMRKNSTRAENKLWYDFLRSYKPRFQRQKTIDGFIADFYCHEACLVIEVDGLHHETDEVRKYDTIRTERLERYGLTVIRIPNEYVLNNFVDICSYIDEFVSQQVKMCVCKRR